MSGLLERLAALEAAATPATDGDAGAWLAKLERLINDKSLTAPRVFYVWREARELMEAELGRLAAVRNALPALLQATRFAQQIADNPLIDEQLRAHARAAVERLQEVAPVPGAQHSEEATT